MKTNSGMSVKVILGGGLIVAVVMALILSMRNREDKTAESPSAYPGAVEAASTDEAAEAVRAFLQACADKDWEQIPRLAPEFANDSEFLASLKLHWGGLEIISIGKSFESGQPGARRVPYEVRLPKGPLKMTFPVCYDDSERRWVVGKGGGK
ncbi:hypothetical protein ACFL1X_09155 [Candidatus Hydrogenedentota bacterium]